jgi:hypothetical protein
VCIFSYWIYYVGPGCIVHLPLTGSTVPVCVDPSAGGQVAVASYVHVCPFLSNRPPTPTGGADSHPVANTAPLPVAVHMTPLRVPSPSPGTGWHVSVGSPF